MVGEINRNRVIITPDRAPRRFVTNFEDDGRPIICSSCLVKLVCRFSIIYPENRKCIPTRMGITTVQNRRNNFFPRKWPSLVHIWSLENYIPQSTWAIFISWLVHKVDWSRQKESYTIIISEQKQQTRYKEKAQTIEHNNTITQWQCHRLVVRWGQCGPWGRSTKQDQFIHRWNHRWRVAWRILRKKEHRAKNFN